MPQACISCTAIAVLSYRCEQRYESSTMCRMALAYTPELHIPICQSDRGFFLNVSDVSIAYQIFGTRVFFSAQAANNSPAPVRGAGQNYH